jgi:hypothetical protein
MPNWKKLIYSGSAAVLTNVTASSYTGSFTGSFSGTFTSASYALSASYAPSAPSAAFPFTGSAEISGSLAIKGGDTSASTKVFHVQTGDGTSIMDFRNNTYAFFGCGQGGGSASGFIFKYTNADYTQFSGYNYGAGAGSYKPILLDTDDVGRSNGIFVNYSTTTNTPPSSTEFAVRGQGTTSSTFTAKFQNNSLGDILTIRDDGNVTVTGKSALNGQVSQTVGALTIVGTTASLDLSTGNFFTLTLVGGATNINPTNITTGQTTTILITSTDGATVTFPTSVKQPSGSSYIPTSTAGAKDILTLISYDTTNVYIANVKNLI